MLPCRKTIVPYGSHWYLYGDLKGLGYLATSFPGLGNEVIIAVLHKIEISMDLAFIMKIRPSEHCAIRSLCASLHQICVAPLVNIIDSWNHSNACEAYGFGPLYI
ncbi:uncharacterized protein N7446_000262 [Penicillium canescens]|uniref:uncharacterized protein n=1 Tax=Penicillium canescens TaxID=5083 RepID=UPI0026E0709F|nr:uncharacterized protein N7446_000262 [Penicillium canescens]KAJ6077326.1 hypothetical protein N7446_000262 [Penicillium canescens]